MVAIKNIDNMMLTSNDEANNMLKEKNLLNVNSKKRKIVENDPPVIKKGKIDNKDLYKQPTVEELNNLRETENQFQSNLIKLQIEELLNSVKVKSKYKTLFQSWFEKFSEHLKNIKNDQEFDLNDDGVFEKYDIKLPLKNLPNDCKGIFKYMAPSNIIIGGSYSLDTIIRQESAVDVLVEMPGKMFQLIDRKNYRYMRKKAMYLAFIASEMDGELSESKSFTGNHLNPVLKIVPPGILGQKFVIYIHLVVHETAFLPRKDFTNYLSLFTAEKNNIKSTWLNKKSETHSEANLPTPYYNNVIMQDLTSIETNLQNVKEIQEYPNIRDGIILLKLWLRQREFNNNFESFNGHIITMYVLYLLYTRQLNRLMSSYQVVRITWKNLADANWCKDGISLCKGMSQDEKDKVQARIQKYHEHFDCVFLDSTGFCNIAASIHENTFEWISNQAKISIECINNTQINSFQMLFLQRVSSYRAFDCIVRFKNPKALENILEVNSEFGDKLNYRYNTQKLAIKYVLSILKKGLGNRIFRICVLPCKSKEWDINSDTPSDLENFNIGLEFDSSNAYNIIEKGPGANLPEAKQFRVFWGDKSELRRFKDSSICETVVWAKENATVSQRREVPMKIIKFLLEQKLKLFEKTHYFFFYNQIEEFIQLKKIKVTKFNYGIEEASLQVINAFNSVEKELSNLKDLPLLIKGAQGCSSVFRYTDIFPPLSSVHLPDNENIISGETHHHLNDSCLKKIPRYLPPIEVVLELHQSGKWPEDLTALRLLKAEFYMQIADRMRNESKLRAHANLHHIDIMKDGFIFRVRLVNQKEIGLVKEIVGDDGVTKYRDNEESLEMEKNLIHLPKLTGALYGIYSQHPSFGPACCLVKRWLSAQLIDDSLMPHIVVELLVASIYLNSHPYNTTQTPMIAFLRFLEFFAREQWNTDLIIVNFNNELEREQITVVENISRTSRESLPPFVILTPYDSEPSMWTKQAPNFLILNRISDLAKEVLILVETQLFSKQDVCFDPLFIPPLSAYDCIIKLRKSMLPRNLEAISDDPETPILALHSFKNHPKTKIPIVGFDPAANYLKELRKNYGMFAVFFHDTYGGNIVGVLLKPKVFAEIKEKEFKSSRVACQEINENSRLIFKVSKMLEDFYTLGQGLVKTIDVQSEKLKSII